MFSELAERDVGPGDQIIFEKGLFDRINRIDWIKKRTSPPRGLPVNLSSGKAVPQKNPINPVNPVKK